MEFTFLPKLPNSNLDDRSFKDLVEECLLRIPRYCPEWTNYNPSDPGVTLIELFAWLTDQMQLRFNQVPRRHYVTFLELLGIRLNPPKAAQTDLTFYLVAPLGEPVVIPQDTEVATERTATEEAIIFSTDLPLVIGTPSIRHFLTADQAETRPHRDRLNNIFSTLPGQELPDRVPLPQQTNLFPSAQDRSCFYVVLDASEEESNSIQGNVLELLFTGEAATGTGINPNDPPLAWQVWTETGWQTIQRQEDRTKGFNFEAETARRTDQLLEAGVVLHLPCNLQEQSFDTDYSGYWLRCIYTLESRLQGYSTPPRILGLGVQAIGGMVSASHCVRVEQEFLGVSDGKPGQKFQLQMTPALDRQPGVEYVEVRPPGEAPQQWQEVPHFGTSGPDDLHYLIDSITGEVQFGPVVRGPRRLKRQTQERAQFQEPLQRSIVGAFQRRTVQMPGLPDGAGRDATLMERQYGRVPPAGSEIVMVSYRSGGGRAGNVQENKLTVLKSSVPYVGRVTNHDRVEGGSDGETLDEVVIRVPELIRTRECAVTPEDFERVVKQVSGGQISRARCLTVEEYTTPGVVRLLLIPAIQPDEVNWMQGIAPHQLSLSQKMKHDLWQQMRDRRPIGIHVKFEEPEYVGVSVVIRGLMVAREYNTPRARRDIRHQLLLKLYQFLNPLTGGVDGNGWEWGRSVSLVDIIAQCQQVQGLLHLGEVQLYEIRQLEDGWHLAVAPNAIVDPGPFGLISSWADGEIAFSAVPKTATGHEIHFDPQQELL